jgi:hypothetical protein
MFRGSWAHTRFYNLQNTHFNHDYMKTYSLLSWFQCFSCGGKKDRHGELYVYRYFTEPVNIEVSTLSYLGGIRFESWPTD